MADVDTTPRIVKCPTCRTAVKWTSGNQFRPFCSERCKLIDLGAWASEELRIPGDTADVSSDDLEPE